MRLRWIQLPLSAALAVWAGGPAAVLGAPAGNGSIGGGYGDTVDSPSGTAPESKLWWNDGAWWGSLFAPDDGAYHIFELNPAVGGWLDTGIRLDDRPGSRADVLWDGRHLYVVSHVFARQGRAATDPPDWARLYRLSYDRRTRGYSLDPGFPVNIAPAAVETMVLAKDSTGRLWVAYVQDGLVTLNRSTTGDRVWGTPFSLPYAEATVNPTDAVAVFPVSGDKLGVLWTNQINNTLYFAARGNCAAEAEWGAVQTALRAPGLVDDQLSVGSVMLDGQGWVYAAAKTASGGGGDAVLIWVLTRRPDGRWVRTSFGVAAQSHQRPSLAIDAEARRLYVFATVSHATGGQGIYFKSAALPHPTFPYGVGSPLIRLPESPTPDLSTTTKQVLGARTGLAVLASDDIARAYTYATLDLGTPSEGPAPETIPPLARCDSR